MGRKLAVSRAPLDLQVTTVKNKKRNWHGDANAKKPFVAWDGEECKDAGYCLFGSSVGLYIRKPHLSTEEMLDLIIRTGKAAPGAFHVGFSFYYDVNQILKDIGKLRIAILHKRNRVTWHNYTIEYIPHKIFTVSRFDDEAGKIVRVRIDDCWTYFRSRFDKALEKYGIGLEYLARISEGKDERENFVWSNIDWIEEYWRLELTYLVELMDRLRKDVNDAGFYIGQWHGPGALASYALKQHGMGAFKRPTPKEILPAVMGAYSAGWFERYQAGVHDGPVYTGDINSAYVYAISLLPNLANGVWRHVGGSEITPRFVRGTRFAVYHISRRGGFSQFMASCHGVPQPLALREKSGVISHPVDSDGWYWSPEAALVAGDGVSTFLEAWVFEDDGTYPFKWVAEQYEHRLLLQRLGNPAEKVIKWMLASLYGRVAQRVGWDQATGEPPAWHQLEWAGFITSMCRSMCYRAAMDVALRDGLVSVDTDGIMSTVPFSDRAFPTGIGDGLGQWKVEEFTGLIYIQNGVYWLKDGDGKWVDPKLRGVDKDAMRRAKIDMSGEAAIKMLENGENLKILKKRFVGYGQALNGQWEKWRTWEEAPMEIDIHHSGKRQHLKLTCRACKQGYGMTDCLHDLAPMPADTFESQPHELPWLNPKRADTWDLMKHYAMTDDL